MSAVGPPAPRVPRFAGIVLAAGASRRMGEGVNKLTLPVGGRPMVAWPVAAMVESGVDPVFVVLGHEGEAVRSALVGFGSTVRFVASPDWAEGMGRSLARGAAAARDAIDKQSGLEGVFVSMGDLPGLRPSVVGGLVEAWSAMIAASPGGEPRSEILVPCCEGRRGHPVLFGAAHVDALTGLSGDQGARRLLVDRSGLVREVECANPAILQDVDTLQALAALDREPAPGDA